ncbi:MAG: pyruvate carboxylase subunit B, partial [Halobacteria archaeon]
HMEALRAGADILDTSMSAMAWGTSHPPTESVVAALRGTDHDTRYDLGLLAEINRYFEKVWRKYAHLHSEETLRVDPSVILHQIPGGMYSNLVSQLKQQGALDQLPRVLSEVPRVRADLGFPPLVTPTSQIVGTQAVLNVLLGERYKGIPKEVKDYVRGMYGEPPGPISDDIRKKILGPDWKEQVIRGRPADLLAPRMSALRQEAEDLGLVKKPEDVLTYALYPDVATRFLRGEVKPEFTSDQLPLKKPETAATAAPPSAGPGRIFTVEVGAKSYTVRVVEPGRPGDPAFRAPAAPSGPRPPSGSAPSERAAPTSKALPPAPEGAVRAPMQGTILRVKVTVGDAVKAGQVLAVLEAMKMENDVVAPRDGVVKEILVQPGRTVQAGAGIVVLSPGRGV